MTFHSTVGTTLAATVNILVAIVKHTHTHTPLLVSVSISADICLISVHQNIGSLQISATLHTIYYSVSQSFLGITVIQLVIGRYNLA